MISIINTYLNRVLAFEGEYLLLNEGSKSSSSFLQKSLLKQNETNTFNEFKLYY